MAAEETRGFAVGILLFCWKLGNSVTSTTGMNKGLFLLLVCLSHLVQYSLQEYGHLEDPPGRGSMWRYGFNTPVNPTDNSLNCGGKEILEKNNGLCGVCGDPYNGVRDHESGGKFATGLISKSFPAGTVVLPVTIRTISPKMGSYQFRICEKNKTREAVTQACLDQNLLPIQGTSGFREEYSYNITPLKQTQPNQKINVKLPPGMSCSHCVFQWKFISVPDRNGRREEYVNCADISIGERPVLMDVATGVEQPAADVTSRSTTQNSTEMANSELLEALLVLADVNPVPDKITPLSDPTVSPLGNELPKHDQLLDQLQRLGVLVPVDPTPPPANQNPLDSLFSGIESRTTSNPDLFIRQLEGLGVLVPVETVTPQTTVQNSFHSVEKPVQNANQINQTPNIGHSLQPLKDMGVIVPIDHPASRPEETISNIFSGNEAMEQATDRHQSLAQQLQGLGVISPVEKLQNVQDRNVKSNAGFKSNAQQNNIDSSMFSQNAQQGTDAQSGSQFNDRFTSNNQQSHVTRSFRQSSSSFSSSSFSSNQGAIVSPSRTQSSRSSSSFSESVSRRLALSGSAISGRRQSQNPSLQTPHTLSPSFETGKNMKPSFNTMGHQFDRGNTNSPNRDFPENHMHYITQPPHLPSIKSNDKTLVTHNQHSSLMHGNMARNSIVHSSNTNLKSFQSSENTFLQSKQTNTLDTNRLLSQANLNSQGQHSVIKSLSSSSFNSETSSSSINGNLGSGGIKKVHSAKTTENNFSQSSKIGQGKGAVNKTISGSSTNIQNFKESETAVGGNVLENHIFGSSRTTKKVMSKVSQSNQKGAIVKTFDTGKAGQFENKLLKSSTFDGKGNLIDNVMSSSLTKSKEMISKSTQLDENGSLTNNIISVGSKSNNFESRNVNTYQGGNGIIQKSSSIKDVQNVKKELSRSGNINDKNIGNMILKSSTDSKYFTDLNKSVTHKGEFGSKIISDGISSSGLKSESKTVSSTSQNNNGGSPIHEIKESSKYLDGSTINRKHSIQISDLNREGNSVTDTVVKFSNIAKNKQSIENRIMQKGKIGNEVLNKLKSQKIELSNVKTDQKQTAETTFVDHQGQTIFDSSSQGTSSNNVQESRKMVNENIQLNADGTVRKVTTVSVDKVGKVKNKTNSVAQKTELDQNANIHTQSLRESTSGFANYKNESENRIQASKIDLTGGLIDQIRGSSVKTTNTIHANNDLVSNLKQIDEQGNTVNNITTDSSKLTSTYQANKQLIEADQMNGAGEISSFTLLNSSKETGGNKQSRFNSNLITVEHNGLDASTTKVGKDAAYGIGESQQMQPAADLQIPAYETTSTPPLQNYGETVNSYPSSIDHTDPRTIAEILPTPIPTETPPFRQQSLESIFNSKALPPTSDLQPIAQANISNVDNKTYEIETIVNKQGREINWLSPNLQNEVVTKTPIVSTTPPSPVTQKQKEELKPSFDPTDLFQDAKSPNTLPDLDLLAIGKKESPQPLTKNLDPSLFGIGSVLQTGRDRNPVESFIDSHTSFPNLPFKDAGSLESSSTGKRKSVLRRNGLIIEKSRIPFPLSSDSNSKMSESTGAITLPSLDSIFDGNVNKVNPRLSVRQTGRNPSTDFSQRTSDSQRVNTMSQTSRRQNIINRINNSRQNRINRIQRIRNPVRVEIVVRNAQDSRRFFNTLRNFSPSQRQAMLRLLRRNRVTNVRFSNSQALPRFSMRPTLPPRRQNLPIRLPTNEQISRVMQRLTTTANGRRLLNEWRRRVWNNLQPQRSETVSPPVKATLAPTKPTPSVSRENNTLPRQSRDLSRFFQQRLPVRNVREQFSRVANLVMQLQREQKAEEELRAQLHNYTMTRQYQLARTVLTTLQALQQRRDFLVQQMRTIRASLENALPSRPQSNQLTTNNGSRTNDQSSQQRNANVVNEQRNPSSIQRTINSGNRQRNVNTASSIQSPPNFSDAQRRANFINNIRTSNLRNLRRTFNPNNVIRNTNFNNVLRNWNNRIRRQPNFNLGQIRNLFQRRPNNFPFRQFG